MKPTHELEGSMWNWPSLHTFNVCGRVPFDISGWCTVKWLVGHKIQNFSNFMDDIIAESELTWYNLGRFCTTFISHLSIWLVWSLRCASSDSSKRSCQPSFPTCFLSDWSEACVALAQSQTRLTKAHWLLSVALTQYLPTSLDHLKWFNLYYCRSIFFILLTNKHEQHHGKLSMSSFNCNVNFLCQFLGMSLLVDWALKSLPVECSVGECVVRWLWVSEW